MANKQECKHEKRRPFADSVNHLTPSWWIAIYRGGTQCTSCWRCFPAEKGGKS